ncbi:MAG: tyrosine phosphatase family protein [Pseudolabrys sp.]
MIHVCSLARVHDTVGETGARHLVTLLRNTAQIVRPDAVAEKDHLILSLDDIVQPMEGYVPPADAHVEKLVEFVTGWDRAAPLVVHCFAGISRSTAGAYVAACALNPDRDEMAIAQALRQASPTATPNARIVALADRFLSRRGRMIAAIESIGVGAFAAEGTPFRLDLE